MATDLSIRRATAADSEAVQALHRLAFGQEEGEIIARLVVDLQAQPSVPPTLSLVAEVGGHVAGHVIFSPVSSAGHPHFQGFILAPVGVLPAFQKQGVASALITHGLQHLRASGVHEAFVYGDPAYYGRFGFTAQRAVLFLTPCPLQYPFGWQSQPLNECVLDQVPMQIRCVPALNDPALW